MSTATSRSMGLLRLNFQELYERHLCRHSQFGVNVAHLTALLGIWYAVYGVVYWLVQTDWVLVVLAAAYLAVLAPNAPTRVLVVTGLFVALLLTALFWLPRPPVLAYLVMIPVFYKLQSWSHKVWSAERDMTEFNKKYTKGFALSVVLLFYEVPIVLNYLIFGRKDWAP